MITYLIVNISIILLTVIFYGSMPKSINLNKDRNDNIKTTLFILLSFGILWFIAGFRGDFTSDYKNYTNLFHHYNSFNFEDVFRMYFYEERGYVVFSRFIGIFTNNEVYLMIATSFLILILFFREIKRNSVYAWLSILIFVNIGSYYTSFNITRQIMATAIVFSASKYLYERCLHKYLIIICIASLFHITSLLMIPFYFILNFKVNKKNTAIIFLSSLLVVLFLDTIIQIGFKFGFGRYSNFTYGMLGLNFTSTVVPLAILLFSFLHVKFIDLNERKYNIWMNAAIYYTFFNIMGLKIQMFQRIAEFFSPYILLLVPLIISKIKDKNLRSIYLLVITTFLILFNYITLNNTGYDPFYFIWSVR